MTVTQALNMLTPKRLIVLNNAVVFNSWDFEEASYWSAQGATVREFYTQAELQRASTRTIQQGWEVSIEGACERVLVTKLTGEVEDLTRNQLKQEARQRRQEAGV